MSKRILLIFGWLIVGVAYILFTQYKPPPATINFSALERDTKKKYLYIEYKYCGNIQTIFKDVPSNNGCVFQITDWRKFYSIYLRESYEYSLLLQGTQYIISYYYMNDIHFTIKSRL
jgi:hypothetical protein